MESIAENDDDDDDVLIQQEKEECEVMALPLSNLPLVDDTRHPQKDTACIHGKQHICTYKHQLHNIISHMSGEQNGGFLSIMCGNKSSKATATWRMHLFLKL